MGRQNKEGQLACGFKILIYLAEHRFGASISDLCGEVHLTRRSIYRYLNTFEKIGIPIAGWKSMNKMEKRYRLIKREKMAELLGII